MTTLTRCDLGRATPPPPPPPPPPPRHPRSTDELIAFTLITLWALETGRSLPAGVPAERLPAAELIAYWSDPAFEQEGAC